MRRLSTLLFLLAFLDSTPAFAQKIRYLHEVFESINVQHTFYGTNITMLANPKLYQVSLPVSIYTPQGDTLKNRPLIIYVHNGNFLPYPVNGQTNGRTSTFGNSALSLHASLGMGFPVDSTLTDICTRLTKMGYVVSAIDYRTGWNPIASTQGERVNTFINAIYRGIQDLRTAIRYFKSTVKFQGNPFGIDTTKIVGWGEGTGGKITLTAAVLDSYSDIVNTSDRKFIGGTELMPVPYVIESMHGDIYGTSAGIHPFTGDTLSLPNHVGFSSDFKLCVNLGGGLADTSWLDGSDLPVIAFHEPRDPFVPYKDGYILNGPPSAIPTIFEKGSYLVTQRADKLGLQKQMRDLKLNDIYTQHANQKNDGIEGLYPITGYNQLDFAPWNWWDTTVIVPANNKNDLLTNPNMSAEKARRYIDTILCYFAPRAFAVLNLGTFVNTADFLNEFEAGFKMMPNPMVNHISLQADLPMKSFTLYDLNGQVLRHLPKINTNQLTVYRNELPKGSYFLKIGFEKGVIAKTILVQ